jgi:hypothetical protein
MDERLNTIKDQEDLDEAARYFDELVKVIGGLEVMKMLNEGKTFGEVEETLLRRMLHNSSDEVFMRHDDENEEERKELAEDIIRLIEENQAKQLKELNKKAKSF